MNDQMKVDRPDSVTVSHNNGVLRVVIQKRDSRTDEYLTHTFTADVGQVEYVVERHDVERLTRM